MSSSNLEFTISKGWDGHVPPDQPQIHIKMTNRLSLLTPDSSLENTGLVLQVDAPFYGDPAVPPEIPPGSTEQLWDYEVVEVFFLAGDNKYLEVELAPKGHYLLLQLNGARNITKCSLPLKLYKTEINETRWKGEAVIPFEYFPEKVEKINAYAIHQSGPQRVYMALYPVPPGKYEHPNFHRLEYFQNVDMSMLLPSHVGIK